MDKPWKVIFAFVGVFIAGAIFGGVFTLRASGKRLPNSPGPGRTGQQVQRAVGAGSGKVQLPVQVQPKAPVAGKTQAAIGPAMMRQFTQRLNLTKEQREKIRPIVSRAAEDLQRLRRESLEDTNRVMERMHGDIGDWLKPDQRAELEEMKRAMRERVSAERQKRGDAPAGDGNPRPMPGRQNPEAQNQTPPKQPRSGNP